MGIIKDWNQYIYDELFRSFLEKGYACYDYLPPLKTSYPFIHLGEISITPIPYKDIWGGEAEATVNVWGSGDDRALVSKMANDIVKIAKTIKEVNLIPEMTNIRVIKDTSTEQDLWRAIINLNFKFR